MKTTDSGLYLLNRLYFFVDILLSSDSILHIIKYEIYNFHPKSIKTL